MTPCEKMTAVKQNRPLAPIYLGVKPFLPKRYTLANAFAHIPGIDAQNIGDDKLAVMYKMQLTAQWSRWV